MKSNSKWLGSPGFDLVFILLPPFYCLAVLLLFPALFTQQEVNPIAWLILVLGIDVAHVYSTLFRTYFKAEARKKWRKLLIVTPIVVWVVALLLYQFGDLIFWRVIAYLAVYHFVRQQYGFFKLYNRGVDVPTWEQFIDMLAIYGATLYPIIFWHLSADRNFNWFLAGDFWVKPYPELIPYLGLLYGLILLMYLAKEIRRSLKLGLNVSKNILLLGTAFSWYAGIVWFNGDLIFTLFNVVSHGIPYIALVWLFEQKQTTKRPLFKSAAYLFVFVVAILAFAYIEEGLWDGLVWQEHTALFSQFSALNQYRSPLILGLVIPLLVVPQVTHYILDGFIWKRSAS